MREALERQAAYAYLFWESAVLMEPHNRSAGLMGMVYSFADEHLRGVVSEEGDRLGKDESRQEDKLQNSEDSTFRLRRPSSVEVRHSHQGNSMSRLAMTWISTGTKVKLSTEDEAGALRIFDCTWQDGSEDALQFWHDEGVHDSLFGFYCKDKNCRGIKPCTSC